jgi:hypothetical protein
MKVGREAPPDLAHLHRRAKLVYFFSTLGGDDGDRHSLIVRTLVGSVGTFVWVLIRQGQAWPSMLHRPGAALFYLSQLLRLAL